MESGTANNESFWHTEAAEDFYCLDNAEKVILHPFVAEMINQMNPSTLLDYGCGDGFLSTLIDPKTEIHLYDSNSDFVNHLVIEKNDRVNVLIEEDQVKENYYDCVVQTSVLMCIETKEELNRIFSINNRSLKEGGSLVVVMTHPCFLQYKFGHYHTSFDHHTFKYLQEGLKYDVFMKREGNPLVFSDYHWSISTIVNLIIKNGFQVKKIIEHPDLPYSGSQPNPYAVPWMFILATKRKR
jgi:SAM-dependent methyltransferase